MLRTVQGQEKSIFRTLLSMIRSKGTPLEVDHSLAFMKVITQGQDVACQDVLSSLLAILMTLCSSKNEHEITEIRDFSARSTDRMATDVNTSEDAVRIKAAAVLRNLASTAEFCLIMSEKEGMLEVLGDLLCAYPRAGYRQALGAFCNFAALEKPAELMLSFPLSAGGEDIQRSTRENTIMQGLLKLTESTDEWTCVQSIATLQNLLEHEHDISKYEADMVELFHNKALLRSEAMEAKIKSALALASLTSKGSTCSIIAALPENKDAKVFGFLIGLERPDPLPEEVVVGLWALCNIAALPTNTANKFLEVDFLLDHIGHHVVYGSDEEKAAAAAGKF